MSKYVKICVLLIVLSLGLMYCTSKEDRSDEQIISKEMGWLNIEGADLRGHQVLDAESGKEVGFISNLNSTIELPAGVYTVTAGSRAWEDVEIKPGETTLLQPGRLEVINASFRGHTVLDSNTGKEQGQISNAAQSMTLIPGNYKVTFGSIAWEATVKAGETTTLKAGVVTVEGAGVQGNTIRTTDGQEVGYVSNTASSFTLPPGEYTIEIDGKQVSFSIQEGQTQTIENK